MNDPYELVARMVALAPTLRPWYEGFKELHHLDDIWLHLANALADQAPDQVITELQAISPLLEEALEHHDDQDQVSLGFIESFIQLAEEKRLDTDALRNTLGPNARANWDSLWGYLHQAGP